MASTTIAKKNVYFASICRRETKVFFDDGIGPMFKIQEICIGEAVWLIERIQGQITWLSGMLDQREDIFIKYNLGCCAIVLVSVMVNLRCKYYKWESTSNHWLPTKGENRNASVGRLATHL